MDNEKIGQLIYTLRKGKGMTQKQAAVRYTGRIILSVYLIPS